MKKNDDGDDKGANYEYSEVAEDEDQDADEDENRRGTWTRSYRSRLEFKPEIFGRFRRSRRRGRKREDEAGYEADEDAHRDQDQDAEDGNRHADADGEEPRDSGGRPFVASPGRTARAPVRGLSFLSGADSA